MAPQERDAGGLRRLWKDATRSLKLFLWVSVPVVASSPTWAATWEIVPSVTAQERYSDNIALVPDANRQTDWVTEVTPGLTFSATGAQLRLSGYYAPQAVYYARGMGENDIFQRGGALGAVDFGEKLLSVDFGGKIDQYNTSLLGPQSTDNLNDTGNRATVASYFASPYLRKEIGAEAVAEARYTGSVVKSDDQESLADSIAQRVDLRLNSGRAFKLFTWNLDYFREDIGYEDEQNDILSEVFAANAKRLLTPAIGLLARVGYDRYEFDRPLQTLDGTAWSAGFDWIPSPRTRFAVMAGRRFYGDDYLLDLSHRSRRTTFSLGYSQNVTTSRAEFFAVDRTSTAGYLNTLFSAQFPDPIARQKAVEEYMARTALPPGLSGPTNFLTSELFLSKRWQTAVGLLGVRNILIANAFREERELLSDITTGTAGAGDFSNNNRVDQTGASLQWTWRMTGQNSLTWTAGRTRSEFSDTGRVDELAYLGLGLSRQFEPRLVGSINYRRQENDSTIESSTYTENAVFATIQKRF